MALKYEYTYGGALPDNSVRKFACNAGDLRSVPWLGRCPGEGHGNHPSIVAWEIPWTEETGGLQSKGLKRVGHQ